MALLYPDPYMRTPGDIDIYLAGGRKRVMQYINKVCPNQVMRYHHVDFPVMKTAIEVHFTPSYMFFPLHNSRMQKWFKEVMDLQCSNVVTLPDGYGEITVSTTSFNVIYILSHLYRHVFTEGIAGDAAYPGGSVYCATKAAVKALSDGLRIDLVDTPLRVTNVKPGMVETNFTVVRYRGDKQAADNFYKGIRPLTGDDIAETVYYAASAPEHVQIAEVLVMPTYQATGTISYKKKD